MRGLTRRWVMRSGNEVAAPSRGAESALVQRVLRARGFNDADEVDEFCTPRLTSLHPPELLGGAEAAAARLADAIRRKAGIVIYGDYDVDGITGAAILYHAIKAADSDARVSVYVPHRLEEGYGLNTGALSQLKQDGADLVVSVDCGITAIESAQHARAIGLELIITDHHNLASSGALPDAVLVHPRLPGSDYPFGELSGAGVAFKLAWQFGQSWCGSQRVSRHMQQTLMNLLPLAALGTIADVVPLVGENRIIASYGLRLIKQTPIVGLRALIEASGLMDESIDSEKVGFVLGPRLNACGRMGHAAGAVRLLTDAVEDEAVQLAKQLTDLNRQRRETERRIFEQSAELAEELGMTSEGCRIIVLAHEAWHPGVVGIVCSRLTERFGRPAVLLQQDGELCRGSARSIDGYSIHGGLSACARHLVKFGGHDAAAGLTLRADTLSAFVNDLTAHANERISTDQLTPTITIDCDADIGEMNLAQVREIGTLSPFGRSNPTPTVRLGGVRLAEPPRQMGGQGKHLSLRLRSDGPPEHRRTMRTVWWNRGGLASDLASGQRLDVVIEPKINTWAGRVTVEGTIRDVRVCEV